MDILGKAVIFTPSTHFNTKLESIPIIIYTLLITSIRGTEQRCRVEAMRKFAQPPF